MAGQGKAILKTAQQGNGYRIGKGKEKGKTTKSPNPVQTVPDELCQLRLLIVTTALTSW